MNPIRTVVFDLDDTLIHTHTHYLRVREDAYLHMQKLGLDTADAERHLNEIEYANIKLFGFSKERFPLSLAALYKRLCELQGVKFDHRERHRVEGIGWSVYETAHPLITGAKEILESLALQGYKLHLFTKGDVEIQNSKITNAGLWDYFHSVTVCPDKTVEAYQLLITKLGLDPTATVMVGDSIKSDINPAIAAGMRAIHIPPEGGSWVLEMEEPHPSHARVASLQELPPTLYLPWPEAA